MADVNPITPARQQALLSVSISWTLRETLARFATAYGLSMSEVVEVTLRQGLLPEVNTTHHFRSLLSCLEVAHQCWVLFPPLPLAEAHGKEHIYFMQAEGTNFVKIGRSLTPLVRLREVQTGCMYRLKMLKSIAVYDAERCEVYWHKALRTYHMHGEWFNLPVPFFLLLARIRQH